MSAELLKAFVQLLRTVVEGQHADPPLEALVQSYEQLQKRRVPSGNTLRFVEAAQEKRIPVQELPANMLLLGIGKHGRWLESSFTDRTSMLGTSLARGKLLAAQLLRQSGMPVPDHRLAETADRAVEVADELGYPVVVKPVDLDGGRGVAAWLMDADEVRLAFDACCKLSSNVLVEKHVVARDYRIVVFQNQAIFAIERVPGGVTGNGVDNIEILLAGHNDAPLRASGTLAKLILDAEALALLKYQGLEPRSVPNAGQFVRMRRASNIASGGAPVAVFDIAHRDNLALAVRAARTLRLDLAGVDLLVPDIARSWYETGGAICEVNAQPSLGQVTSRHIYGEILESLVPGEGRVPAVLIVGAADPAALAAQAERVFAGRVVGCHDPNGIRIAGDRVLVGAVSPFRAGQLMALDPRVEAIVLCVNDLSPLATGLPVDCYDALVLAGRYIRRSNRTPSGNLREMVHSLLPACAGAVIPLEGCAPDFAELRRSNRARWTDPTAADNLTDRLIEIFHRNSSPSLGH
jgi:cyanophycin synthetase